MIKWNKKGLKINGIFPHTGGVYCISIDGGECYYIGRSNDLSRRVCCQHYSGNWRQSAFRRNFGKKFLEIEARSKANIPPATEKKLSQEIFKRCSVAFYCIANETVQKSMERKYVEEFRAKEKCLLNKQ